jgi:hypothetical protein
LSTPDILLTSSKCSHVKTKGNLDKQEDALLKQSLTHLRLTFVKAVEHPPKTAPPAPPATPVAPPAAPPTDEQETPIVEPNSAPAARNCRGERIAFPSFLPALFSNGDLAGVSPLASICFFRSSKLFALFAAGLFQVQHFLAQILEIIHRLAPGSKIRDRLFRGFLLRAPLGRLANVCNTAMDAGSPKRAEGLMAAT